MFQFKKKLKKQEPTLEPEEVFLDDQNKEHSRIEIPIKSRNFILFYLVVIFVSLFFLSILCYHQILKKDDYLALAERNYIRVLSEPAARGVIYDRFDEQLVFNQLRYDLVFWPQQLRGQPEEVSEISQLLTSILERPLEQIKAELYQLTLQDDAGPVILKKDLSHEEILLFEERFKNDLSVGANLAVVSLEKNLTRRYVDGQYFSHLLGYLGQVNEQELKDSPEYLYFEKVGRANIESLYQSILRGQPWQQEIKVNAQTEILNIFNKQAGQAGQSLRLTLDAPLQRFASEALKNKLKELNLTKGVVLVQDPQNGQILALVSLPSFDNNLFSSGLDQEAYQGLSNHLDKPLFNRAIAGLYPPGSTIKPFVGTAILEEAIISPYRIIDCHGGISVVNQYNPEIVYHFRDYAPHGPVDFFSAIAKSCNSYFYMTGGGYQDIDGLGVDRINQYLSLFNFGQTTGLDLPSESLGLLPNAQWKEEQKGEPWYIGDTYHLAIGQGDLLVTPLQMSTAMSALANDGRLYQPFLVSQILDSQKNLLETIEPKIINQDFISQKNLALVKKALRQSVTQSFLRPLADLPYPVAGKTGTAEFSSSQDTHAWFVGFGPYEDPKLVITVLIEAGGLGVSSAMPVAKQIFNWYFEKRL